MNGNSLPQSENPAVTCVACKYFTAPAHCRNSGAATLAQQWGYLPPYFCIPFPWHCAIARDGEGACGPEGKLWEDCGRVRWRLRKRVGAWDILPNAWVQAKRAEAHCMQLEHKSCNLCVWSSKLSGCSHPSARSVRVPGRHPIYSFVNMRKEGAPCGPDGVLWQLRATRRLSRMLDRLLTAVLQDKAS